ncbi:OB-fold-containig protein [Lewinella cohaerens]|uniref:OB-fold-containig protein n=1 Tax=Lewinella cohaerens TaxID=70995 RepID=UPI00037EA05D|nr:OB-fold-containig protein [Lewinella cohaerens]
MQELFQVAVHPLNLVYTVLMALVVLYWLSVILGAIDISAFDFDFDADLDVDVDVDVDADFSLDGLFASALHFFHFDRVPFMLIMSLVVLSAWSMTVLTNHYWGNYSAAYGLALAAPILLIAFLLAKILSYPLIPLFARMNTAAAPVEYVGMQCRVKLPPYGKNFGQGGVYHDGDELLVNIKSTHSLKAGEETVIIGRTEDKRYWLVEPLDGS